MLFGSGMPLLYMIVAGGLLLRSFTDKHMLLRWCKMPPRCAPLDDLIVLGRRRASTGSGHAPPLPLIC